MILTIRITAVRVPLCCGRFDRSKQQRAEPGGRLLSSTGLSNPGILTGVRYIATDLIVIETSIKPILQLIR
jgi:hypothetical protein